MSVSWRGGNYGYLVMLLRPVLPRPLSDLGGTFLGPATRLRRPWLPDSSSWSGSPPPASPPELDFDLGMFLACCSPSTGAWLLVLLASAFFTFLKMPPDSALAWASGCCCPRKS